MRHRFYIIDFTDKKILFTDSQEVADMFPHGEGRHQVIDTKTGAIYGDFGEIEIAEAFDHGDHPDRPD